jgi:hypothetical protein
MIPTPLKAILVAAVMLCVPATASAATIQLGSVIKYEAAPGERNDVRVALVNPNEVAIRDVASPITNVPARCVRIDQGVSCPFTTGMSFHLGDGNDDFMGTSGAGIHVFGGVGDDRARTAMTSRRTRTPRRR